MRPVERIEDLVSEISSELNKKGIDNIISEDSRSIITYMKTTSGRILPFTITLEEEYSLLMLPIEISSKPGIQSLEELGKDLLLQGIKVYLLSFTSELSGLVFEYPPITSIEDLQKYLEKTVEVLEKYFSSFQEIIYGREETILQT